MTLASELHGAQVGVLDLGGYVTAEEETTAGEVIRRMRATHTAAALITREGRICGIFTERDVLHKLASRPRALQTPVRELMTRDPVVIGPRDTLHSALRLMTEGHIRNLPVVGTDGRVLGNLTDNAIVQRLGDVFQAEVLNLPPNPDQVADTVEGA